MTDEEIIREIANLAAGLKEPARARDVRRYHEALLKTMNRTTDPDGSQDALAVCEAISLLIGQIIGGSGIGQGMIQYIAYRASQHAEDARRSGIAAMHMVEREPTGRH